jgi:N,N'-diacetyllegionaminate synthase
VSTLIIAEAGVNHNGEIRLAKRLIEIAAESGADFVKFQTFYANRLVSSSALKADYQLNHTDIAESQHEMLLKLELSEAMHHQLIAHCHSVNIGFFSTGFDIDSVNMLLRMGQEFFKIPSGEITNLPYLRHIGRFGKKIILSTGMSDLKTIAAAISVLESVGTNRSNITVLHCTTAYPAPMTDVNLRAMDTIKDNLNVAVGYSDHTLGIEIPIAAVALGATVIEKHFTVDRNLPGPDHKASIEPEELKSMVTAIRNIEIALGDGVKKLMPSEIGNRSIARKSIVANEKIFKGEFFTENNLTTKRPGTGISPMEWDRIIGTKAHRNFLIDELIDES